MDKPNYYSILTADVRYDQRLTDSEKILFSELTSLTNKTGECWASNEYFVNLYKISERTISRRLDNLEKCGYIQRNYVFKTGTKYIEKRIIKVAKISMTDLSVYGDKVDSFSMTELTPYGDRNVQENIKLSNNKKDNNKRERFGSQENVLLTKEEYKNLQETYPSLIEKYIEDLSLYLAQTGKKYQSHNATIRNWIRRDKDKPIYKSKEVPKVQYQTIEADKGFTDEELEKIWNGEDIIYD